MMAAAVAVSAGMFGAVGEAQARTVGWDGPHWSGPYKKRSTCDKDRKAFPWVTGMDGISGRDVNYDGIPDWVSGCKKYGNTYWFSYYLRIWR